jgi:hypothetical protein
LNDTIKNSFSIGIVGIATGLVFGWLMYRKSEQRKMDRIASGLDEERPVYRLPVYEDEENRPTIPMHIPDWARR